MIALDYWVIIHKPSGNVIPVAKGFNGRGGSHVEPADPHKLRPRLFTKEATAKGWLTTWLKGKVTEREYRDYEGNWCVDQDVIPVVTRKREEMEIIKARLVI